MSNPETTQSSVLSTDKSLRRWLITGGCGFIGTSLIKKLVEEGGHFIRVIDNLSVGTREDLASVCNFVEINSTSLSPQSSVLSPNKSPQSSVLGTNESYVELIVGDILDETLALKAAKGMEVIVHLAANTGVAPSLEMSISLAWIAVMSSIEACLSNDNLMAPGVAFCISGSCAISLNKLLIFASWMYAGTSFNKDMETITNRNAPKIKPLNVSPRCCTGIFAFISVPPSS